MSVFHFALPRNTFSCARDRSTKTRLRSSSSPSGLYPEHPAPSWPTWWPTTFAFDSVSGGRAGCTRDLGTTSGVLFGTLFRPGQLAGAGSSVGCKFGRWLAAATTCRAANRFTSNWVYLECAMALVDSHHRSALWRWALVRAVRKRSKDPDTVIVEWLRHGAPVRMQRFSVDLEHDGLKPARDDLQGCRSLTTDVDDALL